jgi:hypothetical protein
MKTFNIKNTLPLQNGKNELRRAFPQNIKELFHTIVERYRDEFPKLLGGKWPKWVDESTFRNNKWIDHEV